MDASHFATFISSAKDFLANNPSSVPTLILVLYLTQVLYYIFLHPLSAVPGPLLAKFSTIWLTTRYARGTWHDDALDIHRRYGPVVRIAPNEVSFVDKEGLKAIYGHGRGTLKTPWYSTWVIPSMENSFFATQDPEFHKLLRSRVSNTYSMSSILAMEPYIQGMADKLWAKLRTHAKTGELVDMSKWAGYFAFDVVGQLGLGGELGMLEQEKDTGGLIASVHHGFHQMSSMGHIPWQTFWINNPVWQFLQNKFGSDKNKGFGVFIQWLAKNVEDRIANGLGDRRPDMMQHFVEMRGLPGEDHVAQKDVMIEGVNIIGAGADTTTVAISAVLGSIALHSEILPRLQREVDGAYDALGLAPAGSAGEEISYTDATKLPYLCAVIKEAMRLHPSIQFQLPRFAPEQGISVAGYFLPKGTHMGISPRSMNRCKEIFGADADEFVPDRWLADTPEGEESIKEMSRLLTTTDATGATPRALRHNEQFGMGSRVCIGQNIALVEVHKFAAQFVRHFELELADSGSGRGKGRQPWRTRTTWFAYQADFWVRLHSRGR